MKKISLAILIVILTVVLYSVWKKDSGDTIKIVALYPLTGGLASWGESSQRGTQMAVDEINKSGGIHGKKIEVIYGDHQCDPKVALSIFQQYIATSEIFTSSSCSGTVLSIAPNLQTTDAFLLATVVASKKISSVSPNVYRNWVLETRQSDLIAERIKANGISKVGIIYEQTDYGKGLADELTRNLEKSNVKVVSESFATGATDVRTQLTKLQAANVETLFVSPQTEVSSEVVFSQMKDLKFKPKLFVNDIVLGSKKLLTEHSTLLEGAEGGNFVIKSNEFNVFLEEYKSKYASECPHTTACAVAYDTMYILADAIKKNGVNIDRIKDHVRDLNYKGISGDIQFDQNNDRAGVGYKLSKIVNGTVELIK